MEDVGCARFTQSLNTGIIHIFSKEISFHGNDQTTMNSKVAQQQFRVDKMNNKEERSTADEIQCGTG